MRIVSATQVCPARAHLALACLALAVGGSAGCGADARRVRAVDALETTRAVVTSLEASSGGEAPEVRAALADTGARLEETEHAYDLWSGSRGSRAFEHTAACLSVALGELREALIEAGQPVPVDLETAEATMGSFTERPCRRE